MPVERGPRGRGLRAQGPKPGSQPERPAVGVHRTCILVRVLNSDLPNASMRGLRKKMRLGT
jgi:hypothetical protein